MNDTPTKQRRKPRPAGQRAKLITSACGDAYEDGRSDVDGLKEEIGDWKDNLESNNMEQLPKYDEVSTAFDALESASDMFQGQECPDCIADLEVRFTQDTRRSSQSRSTRMMNALSAIGAAKDAAEKWLVENEALEVTDTDGLTDDERLAAEGEEDYVSQEMVDERDTRRGEVEEFIIELENAISEAEGVEFPGMY